MILFCGILLLSCNSDDPETEPEIPELGDSSTAGSIDADTISNHLQFFNATKIQGTIPRGALVSSLKISFEDTLFLTNELKGPIKFLHLLPSKNVAGIYVQAHDAVGGSSASYYYDVPEIPDLADSDSISVIMIAVDPVGLIDLNSAGASSLIFAITIVPYDENGQPIAEDIRPVKIVESISDPLCSLVLPPGDYWGWDASFIPDDPFFYNEPNKVFGAGGQFINGSCCNGVSVYGLCPGAMETNAKLHFATYYKINGESLTFFDDGTFFRETFEDSPLAAPAESNFCVSGEGVVLESLNHTKYVGNWTTSPITLPPNLAYLSLYDNPLQLTLQGTSSSGGGFGNPGGIIRQLDCSIGILWLVQIDREGGGRHLYKVYSHRGGSGGHLIWYPFPKI